MMTVGKHFFKKWLGDLARSYPLYYTIFFALRKVLIRLRNSFEHCFRVEELKCDD